MIRHWYSVPQMTVEVGVDETGMVVEGPPIMGKFIGQHVSNLEIWLRKIWGDGFEHHIQE